MAINKNGYWISEKPDGSLNNLYRVEGNKVFRYDNGNWVPADQIYFELGWNIDFDKISDEEAEEIMRNL